MQVNLTVSNLICLVNMSVRKVKGESQKKNSENRNFALNFHARKRNPNLNFWFGYFRVGWVFSREWVGAKKFGTSLETRETKMFWRDVPGVCQDIPAVPEKFEEKEFVFDFRPLLDFHAENQFLMPFVKRFHRESDVQTGKGTTRQHRVLQTTILRNLRFLVQRLTV